MTRFSFWYKPVFQFKKRQPGNDQHIIGPFLNRGRKFKTMCGLVILSADLPSDYTSRHVCIRCEMKIERQNENRDPRNVRPGVIIREMNQFSSELDVSSDVWNFLTQPLISRQFGKANIFRDMFVKAIEDKVLYGNSFFEIPQNTEEFAALRMKQPDLSRAEAFYPQIKDMMK